MITPIGTYVLVEAAVPPTKVGSIHLPESTTPPKGPLSGVVRGVGDKVKSKVALEGSTVYFARFDSLSLTKDGKEYYFVPHGSLMGVSQ